MKFTPKTEEEIQREGLLPIGEYPFEVIEAKDKVSKNGNQMIEVKVEVFNLDEDTSRFIFDYLMEKMAFKLRHFCAATGLIEAYEDGSLSAEMCQGKTGTCKVGVKHSEEFPSRNEIRDYIVKAVSRDEQPKKAVIGIAAGKNVLEDDDIPF
jgi:hypothetical protein